MKLRPVYSTDYPGLWLYAEAAKDRLFTDEDGVETYTDFVLWMARTVQYGLAIVDEDTGGVAGICYANGIVPGRLAFGHIFLGPCYRDRRIGTWAVLNGMKRCMDDYGLVKFHTLIRQDDRETAGLLKACGFTKDGVLRSHAQVGGKWIDYDLWCITREELENG
ncbi:MAG: hypothetical protein A4E73_00293 [Syntrophaceae bacterium PtaU1.Bin231]|nr:MAG: hypothetical protein A4E73_00293 [Syntrophaceae bacterium PtaU1.Bin231]